MSHLKTILISLATTISLFNVNGGSVNAQVSGSLNGGTATGTVSVFNGVTGYSQTVSGQITLPTGQFNGPLTITPTLTNSPDPLIAPVTDLTINPGGINFFTPPVNFNQQLSQILSGLSSTTDLSTIVSILRANPGLLSSGATSQATASGQTTLIGPINSSIQSVSGEISLPTGLYYDGALSPADATCGAGGGCLVITPNLSPIPQVLTLPRIDQLIIDPGVVNIVFPSYDLNATAASVLSSADPVTELSNIVSIIRAGSGPNGPFSTQTQARATGAVTITTPNGTTQSVSGEITLPAGLYFDSSLNAANTICPGSSCLSISTDIQWNDNSFDPVNGAQANSAFIQDLRLNPGDVQPGDPASPTGLFLPSSFDFNAAVADILYQYIDQDLLTDDQLSNIVSVIRGGAGSNGITPSNRPSASASGSATITLPNGSTQSVTAELTLPDSLYFDLNLSSNSGNFTITPSFQNVPADASDDPNLLVIGQFAIDPGVGNDSSFNRSWNFEAAVADALSKANTLEEQISIIRAVGGAGLE